MNKPCIKVPKVNTSYTISWTKYITSINRDGTVRTVSSFPISSTITVVAPARLTIQHYKVTNSSNPTQGMLLLDEDSTATSYGDFKKFPRFKICKIDDYTNSSIIVFKGSGAIDFTKQLPSVFEFRILQRSKEILVVQVSSLQLKIGLNNLFLQNYGNADVLLLSHFFEIELFNPPVLFVHGLNSNKQDAFGAMEQHFASGEGYNRNLVHSVDYSSSSNDFFSNNTTVVAQGIDLLLKKAERAQISAGKVDVVGHSMGGILLRLYLQSTSYRNDLRRLITINTPHSGTYIADWMTDPSKKALVLFYNTILNKNKLANISDVNIIPGAILDLRVNSPSIDVLLNGNGNRNNNIVPSHTITTTFELPASLDIEFTSYNSSNIPQYILPIILPISIVKIIAFAIRINDIKNQIFKNDQSDVFVSLASQKGGVSATTNFTGQWHLYSAKNKSVIARTYELLTNISSSNFDIFGFRPPNLIYTAANRESYVQQANGNINFSYPTNGVIIKNGDSFNVKVNGTGIKEIYAFVEYKEDSILAMRVSGNELVFKINTNENFYNGEHDLWVFGVTDSGDFVQANQYFVVESTNCVSVRSGDWDDPIVWSCGQVPSELHNVTIKSGHQLNLTQAMGIQKCKKLLVERGAIFVNSGNIFLAKP